MYFFHLRTQVLGHRLALTIQFRRVLLRHYLDGYHHPAYNLVLGAVGMALDILSEGAGLLIWRRAQ